MAAQQSEAQPKSAICLLMCLLMSSVTWGCGAGGGFTIGGFEIPQIRSAMWVHVRGQSEERHFFWLSEEQDMCATLQTDWPYANRLYRDWTTDAGRVCPEGRQVLTELADLTEPWLNEESNWLHVYVWDQNHPVPTEPVDDTTYVVDPADGGQRLDLKNIIFNKNPHRARLEHWDEEDCRVEDWSYDSSRLYWLAAPGATLDVAIDGDTLSADFDGDMRGADPNNDHRFTRSFDLDRCRVELDTDLIWWEPTAPVPFDASSQ